MTNSIASAKCPTVLTSGNYGMSQNRYTDETKDYFFVKLTDSAYRSLEEYQRNATKRTSGGGGNGPTGAKIQFIGNTGIIHFPPTCDDGLAGGNSDGRKFGFSIDDVEGSLECIQQTQSNLDVLGALSYRMRIHANDDVYDTTRTKMAIAEETEKSKCIREIKTNQTDMWRKGKKPSSAVATNPHHTTTSGSSSNTTSMSVTTGSAGGTGTSYHHHSTSSSNNNNNNYNNINHNNGNSSSNSSSFLSNSSNRSSKLVSMNNSPPCGGVVSSSGNSKLSNNSKTPSMTTISLSRSPNPMILGASGITCGGTGSNNVNNRYCSSLPSLTSATSLSTTLAGGISNGYASTGSLMHHEPTSASAAKTSTFSTKLGTNIHGANNGGTLGKGGGVGSKMLSNLGGCNSGGVLTSVSTSSNSKLPDIARRKIRERLIHLLALRPFKKPELYNRLQNEGLRDRERPLISNFLKDISTLSRDNTYNLKRQMWNYVNESWPYYSEQELQQLKRRKPQNLTPPLSSDAGSSTSGQSPTSTHTGSPPPLVGGTNGSSAGCVGNNNGGVTSGTGSLKRTSLETERFDDSTFTGFQPKKQRISHFKKDSMAPGVSGCGPTAASNRSRLYSSSANSNSSYSGAGGLHQQQTNRNSSSLSSYSPHRIAAATAHADDGGNDLSYSVLDNVDDLMSHVTDQTSTSASYGMSRGCKQNTNLAKGSIITTTKRFSGSSTNSSNSTTSTGGYCAPERLSGKELLKKSSSPAVVSPKSTYGGSFVPESKVGSGRNNSNYQRQSPNYSSQRPNTSNGVIFSPKTNHQSTTKTSPREDSQKSNSTNTNSRYRSITNKSTNRTPTNSVQLQQQAKQQHIHQQNPQKQHQTQPQGLSVAQINNNQQQSQQQHPHHSSPTSQQIAAAYASATDTSSTGGSPTTPRQYDFSNYTPITTIEQRRQYKTEFENDYDEYRKLLEQIDSVGNRFRSLAERLDNARQGCPDYYQIKQQIVSEYERISKEESIKRDKQRFDYLHEKLAYIKELVTDYDRKLTAAAAAASTVTSVVTPTSLGMQHQLQKQQQHIFAGDVSGVSGNILMTPRNTTRLSPMVSSGETNNSPPTIIQPQQQTKHRSKKQQQQHFEHNTQSQHYQQQLHKPDDDIIVFDNNAQISSMKLHHQAQQHIINPTHKQDLHGSNDTDSDDTSDSNSNASNDDDSNDDDDEGDDDDDETNDCDDSNDDSVNANYQIQNNNKKHNKNKKHL